MSDFTLKVRNKNTDDWLKLVKEYRYKKDKEGLPDKLIIDFREATFITPVHVVTLACLIEEFWRKGVEISFVESKNYAIDSYLKKIKFYSYWNEGFDRNNFTRVELSSTFCLWNIDQSMIDNYANKAKDYFSDNYIQGKDLHGLNATLTETFNNVFDHAKSPVDGYVMTQYFPKKKEILTVICDFGVGIPETINRIWTNEGKDPLPDNLALRAAVKRKMTSQSTPRNRGFGLARLRDTIAEMRGEMFIFSNGGLLEVDKSGDIIDNLRNDSFNGTLLVVRLYEDQLPEQEDDVDNEDFSF